MRLPHRSTHSDQEISEKEWCLVVQRLGIYMYIMSFKACTTALSSIPSYLHLFIYSVSQLTLLGLVVLGKSLWARKHRHSCSVTCGTTETTALPYGPTVCMTPKPVISSMFHAAPETLSSNDGDLAARVEKLRGSVALRSLLLQKLIFVFRISVHLLPRTSPPLAFSGDLFPVSTAQGQYSKCKADWFLELKLLACLQS